MAIKVQWIPWHIVFRKTTAIDIQAYAQCLLLLAYSILSSFNIQDYKMFSKPKLHTKKVSGKEKYELRFYSRVRIFHLWWR